uniref:MAK10-like protein n=1 Tax=Tanacetum cinerariifolium TaxID=118510 RepID=A0A699GML1_TANCI|nr:MAK10-like protein [Tanacetum cinerariifolium]
MQTRSSSRLARNQSSNPSASTNPNPKGRNRRRPKQRIENLDLDDLSEPIGTIVDQRTMAQLLQAPTEGYEDAIVVPAITADNFELKHGLLTLALLEDLALYDNESWNDPRDFAKPVKAISFPQDVRSTSGRHLIELEHQVQRLMKAYITPIQPTQLTRSLLPVRSVVVLTTLSTAWKIPSKILLSMHPRVLTKREDPERSKLSSEGYDLLSSRIILSEDDYDRECRKPSDLEDRFYRDTIMLGPEYETGITNEEEAT